MGSRSRAGGPRSCRRLDTRHLQTPTPGKKGECVPAKYNQGECKRRGSLGDAREGGAVTSVFEDISYTKYRETYPKQAQKQNVRHCAGNSVASDMSGSLLPTRPYRSWCLKHRRGQALRHRTNEGTSCSVWSGSCARTHLWHHQNKDTQTTHLAPFHGYGQVGPDAFLKLPRSQNNAFPALVSHRQLDLASPPYAKCQLRAPIVLCGRNRCHWWAGGARARWSSSGDAAKGE